MTVSSREIKEKAAMAEDIKDMTIMGEVHEYMKQLKADAYILRDGRILEDHEELFSVGGYSRSFSIDYAAPAIALKYIDIKDAYGLDMSSLFFYQESDKEWHEAGIYFETIDMIPESMKLAVPMYSEFFKVVEERWTGDGYDECTNWKFGHTLVFVNGDGIKVENIPTDEIVVRRTREDGKFNYFYPREGKLIKSK